MTGSSFAVDINKVQDGVRRAQADSVAIEEPLEIRLGYTTPDGPATRSVSITMRTPGNDRELAAGFLFTEAIVNEAKDILSIEPCGPPAPDSGTHNVVRVDLDADVDVDLGRLQRHFYTTSSCGVCGKTSLEALRVGGASTLPDAAVVFSRRVLTTIPDALRAAQHTFEETGGLHAAAAFNCRGELIVTMEDVGRHNAVDKVIGSLLLNDELPAPELGLMVSGRASYEILQKCLMAAVSAPSSLAVQLARDFNMTLIGFLRGETFNIYAGEQRIVE